VLRKVIFLVLVIPFACSSPPPAEEEIMVPTAKMLTAAEMDPEQMTMVSGMLYKVKDFDAWMQTYEAAADGLIIAFRSVDAPNMTLVFEGSKTLEEAEKRVQLLSSEEFLNQSSSFDDPISSYYKIQYVETIESPPTHFFALSYASGGDPEEDWLEFVMSNMNYFKEFNIEPAGIGTDPNQDDRAYLLFRQYDFVGTRKMLNSPRKINKFLEKLELPEQTLISYWIRISQ
jgi:hypothetical protein